MANWALLQEQLTGLPVAKRAKHGIHFQKPDGSFVANFSCKPCHFLDGGLWKPIDTGLLATADGWYSSPHSDVVIHPDGRVRVKNSDYQQFTELPSAKAGRLAGDRIIREFPSGEQHLIMKEDGFREEIHVEKPTFQLEKFIAKTQGSLPSKYKAHPITAEDAEGNSYEFTGDVKAFGAWLDKATYPVVIDPDFAGSTNDAHVYSLNSTYATARSTSIGFTNDVNLDVGQWKNGINYLCIRAFLKFDTSTIPDDNTVTQVNLKLVCITDNSATDFDVQIVKHDWTSQDPISAGTREAAFDNCLAGTADDAIWRNTSGMSLNTQYASGNLTTDWISKTGATYYSLRSNRDFDATSPTDAEYISLGSASNATAGYRPVLTVLYTAGGIPRHFLHYQRMRG